MSTADAADVELLFLAEELTPFYNTYAERKANNVDDANRVASHCATKLVSTASIPRELLTNMA